MEGVRPSSSSPPGGVKDFDLSSVEDVGVATSEYQVSGMSNCPNSQWVAFEREKIPEENRSMAGIDHWNNIDAVIELLNRLGATSYRFSIEWSKVQPTKGGRFDELAVQHYEELCKKLVANGITPMITLDHFSRPIYYAELDNDDAIELFGKFSEYMFCKLANFTNNWATINEPGPYSVCTYLFGEFPCKKDVSKMGYIERINLVAQTELNLLKAHLKVSDRIKKLSSTVSVGLVHNFCTLKPYHWWNPLERVICHYFTKIMHGFIFDFLRTGKFHFRIPFVVNLKYENSDVHKLTDFIGVNYYARPLIRQRWWGGIESSCYPHEKMTCMPYREDPDGLYDALLEAKQLEKPIHLMEVGISPIDDEQQSRFLTRIFYAASKAIKKGCDLKSIQVWSLAKNFEWQHGWDPQNFGLFDFNRTTREFSLRKGGQTFIDLVKAWKGSKAAEKAV